MELLTEALSRLTPKPKSGKEAVHADGRPLGPTLLDFWRWSTSDLISNATRGVLAEFLVASALGIPLDSVREDWGAYDLTTPGGIKVEVKSAAYIQSWKQRKLSSVLFQVPKTRAWNAETNVQETESRRQADLYVFALLSHTHKPSIDPLNVAQWRFYVMPTEVLNARTRSQHSITLATLERLSRGPVEYEALRGAVEDALSRSG